MTRLHGFTLVADERIQETETTARTWRHDKTGARLLSLENSDENKVFGIGFRTPPVDSTGVAHILEHSVLCGSRKYPVKEPFVELLKGSLKTFLNAFTFPDKTCYPVASANLQDFYNLIDVYLDAVFHPRITEEIFKQEGWHYEIEDNELTYKGVVHSEMKGAYSSPDSVLYEKAQQTLFPDNTYGLDSGGDPKIIPQLTYEQFKAFHEDYYNPANAYIWFYGDDVPEERLRIAAAYLDEFEPSDVDSSIALQKPFFKPRKQEFSYPAGDDAAGTFATVSWLLPETTDTESNINLRVLEHVLIGLPSSPLRKALIESGLGEDLTGVGLEEDLRQMYFSTGLKGTGPDKVQEIEALILGTLKELAEKGIDKRAIEAALNTLEFAFRENNTGHFPRGIALMVRSLSTWLYDGDPLGLLRFEAPIARLKERLAENETVFEDMIREHFLDNPHRVTLTVRPDAKLGELREQTEKRELKAVLDGLTPEQVQEVNDQARELARLQEAPDAPEELAKIPRLTTDDLPLENTPLPQEQREADTVPVLYHDHPTSGICYLDAAFDIRGLQADELPWLSLFGRALLEMGTRDEDFVAFGQRIACETGGLSTGEFIAQKVGGGNTARLMLRGKATTDKVESMTSIMADALTGANFNDKERFQRMVLEEKARLEQTVIPSGHILVSSRLGARFSTAGHVQETLNGVAQLQFVRELTENFDKRWPEVLERLESLRKRIAGRGNALFSVTLDGDHYAGIEPHLNALVRALPDKTLTGKSDWPIGTYPVHEGLTIPAQVNYVGKAVSLYEHGWEFRGAALVVSRWLRTSYLWDQIRVRGGAYGAFTMFDELSGVLKMNLLSRPQSEPHAGYLRRHSRLPQQPRPAGG